MDQTATLKRNSILSFLSAAIRILSSALMFVGVARFYGPDIFGSFSTAFVFSTIFVLISDFGFDALMTIEVARNKEKAGEIVNRFFSFKLIFASFALVCIWTIPLILDTSSLTKLLILIFSFSVIFNSLTNYFFALLRGLEQFHHETKITFIVNSFFLVLLVIAGILKLNILYIALIFISTRGLALAFAAYKAQNIIGLKSFRFTIKGWHEDKSKILAFGFSLIFGNLFFQLIIPFLAFLKGDYAVGIYDSAFKLVSLVLILSDILVFTSMPTLSSLYETNSERWLKLSRILNKTFCIISLPISLVFYIYAEQIITFLYGKNNFDAAIPIMKIAAFVILTRFISETYGLMLTTSNRQNLRMLITAAGTLVTLVACLIIIPIHGAYGAAIVAIISNIFVGLGYLLSNYQHFVRWTFEKRYLIPILITLVLGLSLYYLVNIFWIYGIILFLIVYIITVYIGGLNRQERMLIFSLEKNGVAINK